MGTIPFMSINPSNRVPENRPVPVPHKIAVPKKQDDQWKYWLAAGLIVLLLLLLLLLALGTGVGTGSSGTGLSGAGQEESGLGEQGTQGKQTGNTAGETGLADVESAEGMKNAEESSSIVESSESESDTQGGMDEATEPVEEGKMREQSREETITELLRRLGAESDEDTDSQTDHHRNREQTGGDSLVKGDATVNFFGATGKGSKFVFVFDRSGSMTGRPLEAVKRGLIQSLEPLKSNHSFNIIAYDSDYVKWKDKLVPATTENKVGAIKFVENVAVQGGTEPFAPLLEAISQKPEVIFFMTDGEFSLDVNEIVRRSRGLNINTVQFSDGQPLAVLQELAKRTGGDFRLVPTRGLSDSL